MELISDEVLESYEPTGTKLPTPKKAPNSGGRGRSSATRVYGSGTKAHGNVPTETAPRVIKEPPKDPRKERLYILIEDAEDAETLTAIRRLADLNLGMQEVVLVLKDGEGKKPLRMPFKVDASEELVSKLKDLVGENSVKIC